MKPRGWLLGFAALIPLAAFVVWWSENYELVEQKVPGPLQGEARYNQFYALEQVLRARSLRVDSRAALDLPAHPLHDDDTLILAADVRTLGTSEVDQLLGWIERGGQFLFSLPDGHTGRGGPLLDALGLRIVPGWLCIAFPTGERGHDAEDCFNRLYKPDPKSDVDAAVAAFGLLIGDPAHGYAMGRRSRGAGAWLFSSDFDCLSNRSLNGLGCPALDWQTLAPMLTGGTVHLVYSSQVPPLHVLLVEYGWMALLPALLALLAWLWSRSQRLGPRLPAQDAERRALYEHVRAAGEFAFRRGRGAALHAPLRRSFLERLRRDDPLLAALDDAALVDALAESSGLPAAAVRLALQPTDLSRAESFQASIRTLHELEAST